MSRPPAAHHIALALLAAAGAGVAWISALRGGLTGIAGSTEAWLMAHVQRVHWLGDYATAASEAEIPNTGANPLYPWLVSLLSVDAPTAMIAGHALSAAALGLLAVAMWGLWRDVVGPWAAVAGAAGAVLPVSVATAAQARYDSLALALVALAVWAASSAWRSRPSARSLAWPVAGTLVGLAYVTREYLGVVALWALLVATVAWLWRTRRPGAPALGLLQVLLVACALTLPLGLAPWAGLEMILRFSDQQVASRPLLPEILGPPPRRVIAALGAVGWGLALWRAPRATPAWGDRRALLVPGAVLIPFLVFPVFPQQSAQYYLLAPVLLGSGLAGLVGALPLPAAWPRPLRLLPALVALLPVLAWSHDLVPAALARSDRAPRTLHVETNGIPLVAFEELFDWAAQVAGAAPLIVGSYRVENLDSFGQLYLQRPVGFVFPDQTEHLTGWLPVLDGGSVVLVVVEQEEDDLDSLAIEGTPLERWRGHGLQARAWRIEGLPWLHGLDPCTLPYAMRGFCPQVEWREAGVIGWRAGAAVRRDAHGTLVRLSAGSRSQAPQSKR